MAGCVAALLADKNVVALVSAVALTYATAPRYAELAEAIAIQSNVVHAVEET